MLWSGCSTLHVVNPNLKKCVSLWQLSGKKGPNTPNQEQGHFERNLNLQFHVSHSMRSQQYLKIIWVWKRYLKYYNNLKKLTPSVLISINLPILFSSTFGAFKHYSIMGSMNYFGQIFLEMLENNKMKSYFGNSEIDFLSPFLEIS